MSQTKTAISNGASPGLQGPASTRFSSYEPPESRLNVIIVGAGIAGVALAGLLGHSGHNVTVLETAPAIAEVGAGLACAPNVSRLINHWGLNDRILKNATALKATNIVRWENGELLCSAPLMPAVQQRYGAPQYVIHRADLFGSLLEWAQAVAELRVNSTVVSVDFDIPSITLSDGTVLEADVIVGADGMKSVCRRMMAQQLGLVNQTVPTGDAAFRALLPVERIKDPDLRAFVTTEESTRWIGKGGHIQAYPIRNGTLYNMVMVHPDTGFTEESWTARASKAKILEHYGDWDVHRLGKLIDQIPDDNIMEWRLCQHEPLPMWRHGKVVLMGDACHPMLPYVGQGAAQSLEDAAVLHLAFNRIRTSTPGHLELLLKTYEVARRSRAEKVVSISGINRSVLHLPDGPEQQIRDGRFRAVATGGDNPDLFANLETQSFLLNHDPEKDFRDNFDVFVQEAAEKQRDIPAGVSSL
ncbi:hypothetical protein H2200_001501 [Cladophialophora chaetospira]|uniref:FAD-binding domain-containing protein n=1 Tax=Cladophialophora chaetospira TaxID=386627 RepID=A0AA38XL26_9EURO|nr:hypothetical protein H2200_001501 [Cladophialophora chaetospira]